MRIECEVHVRTDSRPFPYEGNALPLLAWLGKTQHAIEAFYHRAQTLSIYFSQFYFFLVCTAPEISVRGFYFLLGLGGSRGFSCVGARRLSFPRAHIIQLQTELCAGTFPLIGA